MQLMPMGRDETSIQNVRVARLLLLAMANAGHLPEVGVCSESTVLKVGEVGCKHLRDTVKDCLTRLKGPSPSSFLFFSAFAPAFWLHPCGDLPLPADLSQPRLEKYSSERPQNHKASISCSFRLLLDSVGTYLIKYSKG